MPEQIGISDNVLVEVVRAQQGFAFPDSSLWFIVIFILIVTAIIVVWYKKSK